MSTASHRRKTAAAAEARIEDGEMWYQRGRGRRIRVTILDEPPPAEGEANIWDEAMARRVMEGPPRAGVSVWRTPDR